MTISMAKASASSMQLGGSSVPILPFAVVFGMFRFGRVRRQKLMLVIAVAMTGLGLLSACGGGGGSTAGGGGGGGASNPVTYTTTVTATSGNLQQTATIALIVH
jgi:hypothetical protein